MRRVCIVAVNIRSTHNIGSIFRTCDGFGAELVLVGITPRPKGGKTDDRLPHISNKAHSAITKTALGAEQTVAWQYYPTFELAIRELRTNGFKIAAIEQTKNALLINQMDKINDIALVVGPEVTGLDNASLAHCDIVYEIPMIGKKESFNVSVAAAISLYQARL